MRQRLRLTIGGGLLVAALLASAGLWLRRHAPLSPAARGEALAREAGCTACHTLGLAPRGPQPPRAGARVPSWDGRELASFARDLGELREWIADGVPARLRDTRGPPGSAAVAMPAYRDRLSARELDDLLAYLVAVSGFAPAMPVAAYEGRVLATELGCFGCHGPSGAGGTPNDGSLTGTIPAWDGWDYAELVQSDAELREWLLDGHPARLWDNPLARGFLERQVLKMPAYRARLSEDELGKLVAYLTWLRRDFAPPAPDAGAPVAKASPAAVPAAPTPLEAEPSYRSPQAVVLSSDGAWAFVANQGAGTVSFVDTAAGRPSAEVAVGAFPSGLALSPDARTLYVSCQYEHRVAVVDVPARAVARSFEVGDEPQGLALSRDGAWLYVANYLSDSVSVLDTASGRALATVAVGRGPRFLALTPDGARLVVSNGLSRNVSIVDTARAEVVETRGLGRASILRDVAVTPDGRWAVVAHVLSRDLQIPVQLERGWIHSNGVSLLDLRRPGHFVTLLLDGLVSGAANPYGVTVSPDGKRAWVTLAGTQEVALVDLAAAVKLAEATPPDAVERLAQDVELAERTGLARRVPAGGLGPRALALSPRTGALFVAGHFSEDLAVLDAATGAPRSTIALGPKAPMSLRRRGELLFNDARITYQTWFSCVSCHEEDAGVDALNWDLPNDGTGNSKNVKSLHDAHDTPPAMWTGVRADMNAAVQAGQRFQGFLPKGEQQRALEAYLAHLEKAPNPHRSRRPDAVARGARLFERALCSTCHPGPRFTDLVKHDLGLGTQTDLVSRFDTPSLRECYRSAPYLHDGRAETLESIFAEHDPLGLHGRAQELTPAELADLLEYVRSL